MRDKVLMRLVFRTRYGKVDELVALMKKSEALNRELIKGPAMEQSEWRYLVDHGGPMFMVVTEALFDASGFNQWFEQIDQTYQTIEYKVWFNQMITCTEAGTRELWRVHMAPPNFAHAQGRISVRNIYQGKYGKADALVEHLSKESALAKKHGIPPLAIYTDLTGPMFTVVSSRDFGSLGEWEEAIRKIDSLSEFSEWRRQLLSLVEVGRREFYRIV